MSYNTTLLTFHNTVLKLVNHRWGSNYLACNVESRLRDGHNKDNSVWMGSSEKNLLEMEGELKNVVHRLEMNTFIQKFFPLHLTCITFRKWSFELIK